MPSKFRLFGGPNGSGKTSLFEYLKSQNYIHTELYVNADRIERNLKIKGSFSFNAYRVKVSQDEFNEHILSSGLYERVSLDNPLFLQQLILSRGVLRINLPIDQINSYHASFVATYLAIKLFKTGQSFCFETVMSHPSKLEFFKLAKEKGYKSYLYFIFTDNKDLNVTRVKLRAQMGLHDVRESAIRDRYDKSFDILPLAFELADDAFIIDNSEKINVIIEKHQGKIIQNIKWSDLPNSIQNPLKFIFK